MTRGAIGFLLHPGESTSVVEAAVATATRCGFRTWITVVRPVEDVAAHAERTELLVTVGGDGTFLFGARLAAPRGVPVLGVNRGRLGFLTDLAIEELPAVLEAFAAGNTVVRRRSMLSAGIVSANTGHPSRFVALNDVVLKSPEVSLVRLRLDADGELLGEFDADGVVLATATGSTGYAMSAGGPPVDPRVSAIVVVPVAPHAAVSRPIVLPAMTVIDVSLERGRVYVAADGQHQAQLGDGDRLRVAPGPELSVVRHAGSPSFVRQLREKVRIGVPLKTERTLPEGRAPSEPVTPAGATRAEGDGSPPGGFVSDPGAAAVELPGPASRPARAPERKAP
jgi:NAD+ kinase